MDFLGREATSTDALAYTHSVEAGKDYFWFDTTADAFKILDQSTYVAPMGAVDHDRLKPIAGPGTGGGGTDTNDYADSLALALQGQELMATIGRTGTLADLTASVMLPAAGISQSDADARYARLAAANTFTGLQTIDRHEYTGTHPALDIIVGPSGDRKALQFHNEDNATAWGSFEFSLGGGVDKPGFALGPGDGARDTNLYRDAANRLRTDDTFDAASFRQDGDALGFTHLDGQLESSQLATDTTLEFTGDTLGVSVQHVIEHSSERIRYVTGASFYSTRGSTVMQIFDTGPFTYRVTHVSWDLDAPATGITARCRLYVLNDNNTVARKLGDSASRGFSERGSGHYLYFPTGGILVPANSRIGVAFSRTDQSADSACFLKAGGQQANSPEHSYNNASEDWAYVGWGEYEHTDPGVGDGTVAHGGSENVYGNANIHYSLVIDHGQIVGDGTVDETHINSENATPGQILAASDDERGEWVDSPVDVELASDFEVGAGQRVEQDLSQDLDDFNWIAVVAGTDDADYGTYLRVPRSAVTERTGVAELLGWVLDTHDSALYEIDVSDGSLTERGSQTITRQFDDVLGAGLAWVGDDLLGWAVNGDTDTAQLHVIDPSDGSSAARGSARSVGSGGWSGAGMTWTGSDLLGWVVDTVADVARLYEIDPSDGSLTARGAARSLPSGRWEGAGLAWTGSELLGWVTDPLANTARLYEIDPSDGSLTARGTARSLGSGGGTRRASSGQPRVCSGGRWTRSPDWRSSTR